MAASSRPRLTPDLHQRIVAAIRAGGYPHVAALAAGVPAPLLEDWLRRGQMPRARDPWRTFAQDVNQAFAQARLRAEMETLQADPKRWLAQGPGRERADVPGWSTAVKPAAESTVQPNALLDPDLLQLVREILEALASFPEAHWHICDLPSIRKLMMAA